MNANLMGLLKTPQPSQNQCKHVQLFFMYSELIHIASTTFIHNFNLMGWGIIGPLGQNVKIINTIVM